MCAENCVPARNGECVSCECIMQIMFTQFERAEGESLLITVVAMSSSCCEEIILHYSLNVAA